MSTTQQNRVRAVSARPAAVARSGSAKPKKLHQKTQFIENLYGTNHPSNHLSYAHPKNKLFAIRSNIQQNDIEEFSKLMPKPDKIPKQRQELFEENLHLKKQLHKVKDQLIKNRTKIQNLNNKNQKYTKQFNRQFQKKIYWNGNNTYLISGIKAQYQKLKEQFELKQQQNEMLKKQLIESRAPQYKVYAQTLQQQNKKLTQKITKLSKVSQNFLLQQSSKSVDQYQILNLENKKQKLKDKLQQANIQLSINKAENKDLHKKIQFLQKLLIEKDNSQYHAAKKAKKLQRQKGALDERIRSLQVQNEDIIKNYETKLQKLKQLQQRRFKSEKDIFDRALNEKQTRIQKLQKEVAYLSTLLTYWKPLDELKDHNIEVEESYVREPSKKQDVGKKKADQLIQPQMIASSVSNRMRKLSQFSQKNGEFILKGSMDIPQQLKNSTKVQVKNAPRQQQTADQRHNQDAEKRRKVDYKQVEHLGQHLKYRFLGLRLNINDVRKYFDYQKQSNPQFILSDSVKNQQDSEHKWQQQYISMKQVKDILQSYPFQLHEEQSYLLARYMVEDSNKQYVYVDLNNQHKRSIVKSIIKALVGNYQILEGQKQLIVEKQCKDMLEKYQSNMISALSTMASSGFISRRKFLELINSLGIELSEEGRDFLVCKMLLKSQSLNKLGYMIIFQ